ncbi:3'-5' exonuclease [Candidatus Riflebacteria bacterium]
MSNQKIMVAIGNKLLESFSRVPKKQQGKVLDFINKFRENPTSSGINYEKIHNAKDPNMRSVRIDQSYRGIVLKPKQGNVYMLLWVDNHDSAYQWAANKVLNINPGTGALQVVQMVEMETPVTEQVAEQEGPIAKVRDRHLIRLGVPEYYLQKVKTIQNESDLDALLDELPEEAYEALYYLLIGESIEDVLATFDRVEEEQTIDTEDFSAALENDDSKRRFYVVEDELELQAILAAPLEKWRIFLHPSQRKLVEKTFNGPARVTGGAGTGKTVVAMHRAAWLSRNVFTGENDRLLFTTYTKNLAADIKENLKKICDTEEMRKIEVVNLDSWVAQFLNSQGYPYDVIYDRRINEPWEKALSLTPSELSHKLDPGFYREEWDQIIQAQGIESLKEYFKAKRTGRGIRLNRKERKEIWVVFEEYRLLLNEKDWREPQDAFREARHILRDKGDILPYKAIIVDEAQDMGPQAFSLIRQIAPDDELKNNIFIVGDANQRIYKHKVTLSHCGINIRGRSSRLRINYRTTEETRKWAMALLKGITVDDLDGNEETQKGYKSLLHGLPPQIHHFENFQAELDFLMAKVKKLKKDEQLNTACLVARTNNLLNQYEAAFSEKDIPTYRIKMSQAEDRSKKGLRLATMHRVKGLEFDHVIIAGVNDGVVPLRTEESDSSDPSVTSGHIKREKALLYVAATRARKELNIVSSGKKSPFL